METEIVALVSSIRQDTRYDVANTPRKFFCHLDAGNAHIDERIMEEVDYYVPTTGFYYFIFANENEITANFIRAHFDMHKTVFDVSSQVPK